MPFIDNNADEKERANEIKNALVKFFKAARVHPSDPACVYGMLTLIGSIMQITDQPEVSIIVQSDDDETDRIRIRVTVDKFTN